jgi:hypothetical protein
MKSRKEEFINHTLPEIFRQMRLLSIDLKDIEAFGNMQKPWKSYDFQGF